MTSCFGAALAYRGAHVGQQLFVVPGLLDEIRCACLHRIDGILYRAVGSDHDDRELGVAIANIVQDFDSVAIRQGEVEQDQVVRTLGQARQSFVAIAGDIDFVAFQFQQRLQRLADGGLVVHDENRTQRAGVVVAAGQPADYCLRH